MLRVFIVHRLFDCLGICSLVQTIRYPGILQELKFATYMDRDTAIWRRQCTNDSDSVVRIVGGGHSGFVS